MKSIRSFFWLFKNIRYYVIYRSSLIRYLICRVRKFYYIRIKQQLKTWNGSQEHFYTFKDGKKTIEYNLTGLHDVSCARSLRLIKPLSCIETYRPLSSMPGLGGTLYDLDYKCEAKVLTIGPRTEGEIFCLKAYGFKSENIRGLDLISYSPYIDVGDMHKLPYEDNSYDIVIASCVLAYSLDQETAIKEILRVLKPNGLICMSHDVNPATMNDVFPRTVEDYLSYFKPYIKNVFYRHELPELLEAVPPQNYTCGVILQVGAA